MASVVKGVQAQQQAAVTAQQQAAVTAKAPVTAKAAVVVAIQLEPQPLGRPIRTSIPHQRWAEGALHQGRYFFFAPSAAAASRDPICMTNSSMSSL